MQSVRFGSEADMCGAKWLSALPPKADVCGAKGDVRFVPIADIRNDLLSTLVDVGPYKDQKHNCRSAEQD